MFCNGVMQGRWAFCVLLILNEKNMKTNSFKEMQNNLIINC